MSDIVDTLYANGHPPAVAVFFGEEDYLVEDAARDLFRRVARDDTSGMNADILDVESTTIESALSVARSYPMMSERRVVWLRRFDSASAKKDRKGRDPLSQYVSDPPRHTTLIITGAFESAFGIGALRQKNPAAAAKKIAAMRFPASLLLANTDWVEFPRMRDSQASSWLTSYCKEHEWKIEPAAVDALLLRCGASIRALVNEIEKVQTFLNNAPHITAVDVESVVGGGRINSVFDLQRAVAKRNMPEAQRMLVSMMSSTRQEMQILAVLTRFFVAAYVLADLRSGVDQATMAQRAGIPVFAVGDHLDAVQAYGVTGIESALFALRDADSDLKSTGGDTLAIMQTLLARIAPSR